MPAHDDIKKITNQLEEQLARIGKERDKLRDLISDLEGRSDDFDAAHQELMMAIASLNDAADTLSHEV